MLHHILLRRSLDSPERGEAKQEVDIVTCEYPPSIGGVGDYTRRVAERLEQSGYITRVWAPGNRSGGGQTADSKVMRTFSDFGWRDILAHDWLMGGPKGKSLLLQWEPVGFGLRSLNLPFCLWMCLRALRGTRLIVMFHETFLPFNKRSVKRYCAGTIQRLMAFTLLNSAAAAFASSESGARSLQRLSGRRVKVVHLPVFSNIEAAVENIERNNSLREQFVEKGEVLIGHFGRYMAGTAPLLLPAMRELLDGNAAVKVLFIGQCGAYYRPALTGGRPGMDSRVFDTGIRSPQQIAEFIAACDLMFQPYPGGITTKRSSTMAALANGRCVASNRGCETERLWEKCAGVHLLATSGPAEIARELSTLLAEPSDLVARGRLGTAFYRLRFSLENTVGALLSCLDQKRLPRFRQPRKLP